MAHKFIKKDGKYYRFNSDNTQTEVQLKDGYFHWTQPDKVKVRVKLDNNLTDMDKSESLLNKIGRIFTNATIGAANADSPAVMTASGWSRNKDGSWSQTDSKGAQELRRNLAVLSGTAYIPTAMATAPLIAPGTTGGAVIGNAAGSMAIGTALEEGQRAVTGQSAGDIISSRLQQAGVPSILADAARPEYYINPTGAAAKTAWNAGNRAVQSVKSRFTPQGFRIGRHAYKLNPNAVYSGILLNIEKTPIRGQVIKAQYSVATPDEIRRIMESDPKMWDNFLRSTNTDNMVQVDLIPQDGTSRIDVGNLRSILQRLKKFPSGTDFSASDIAAAREIIPKEGQPYSLSGYSSSSLETIGSVGRKLPGFRLTYDANGFISRVNNMGLNQEFNTAMKLAQNQTYPISFRKKQAAIVNDYLRKWGLEQGAFQQIDDNYLFAIPFPILHKLYKGGKITLQTYNSFNKK